MLFGGNILLLEVRVYNWLWMFRGSFICRTSRGDLSCHLWSKAINGSNSQWQISKTRVIKDFWRQTIRGLEHKDREFPSPSILCRNCIWGCWAVLRGGNSRGFCICVLYSRRIYSVFKTTVVCSRWFFILLKIKIWVQYLSRALKDAWTSPLENWARITGITRRNRVALIWGLSILDTGVRALVSPYHANSSRCTAERLLQHQRLEKGDKFSVLCQVYTDKSIDRHSTCWEVVNAWRYLHRTCNVEIPALPKRYQNIWWSTQTLRKGRRPYKSHHLPSLSIPSSYKTIY